MTQQLTERELWNQRRKQKEAFFVILMIACLTPWIAYTIGVAVWCLLQFLN
ncbi:hypothetical protein [Cerasicoccus frondis]|uniref:hypothetical protein n=1 Tax=Cerasicoccus frondis TaxID=490090 RepID=UPI002852A2C5|nr:hypothetical protein [Cerasicoccus frondis]